MSEGLLAGKRAVVTGAGSGIGRETARICAREGARVGVLDVDARSAAETVDAITAQHGDGVALALAADLRVEDDVAASIARLREDWGGLDVVIGCAGIQLAGEDDRADRLELDVWQRTIDVNLTGMFLIAKHGIRELLRGGRGGSVVLTCSPTGQFGCAPGYDAYSASKAGVYGLVRVMAADYGAEGIRVNGVVPGYTRSAMTAWVSPEEHEQLLTTIPLGRAGEPAEVGEVIAFLASDRTPYTTGGVWAADGGMTAI
ncbi:MAG TPA: SDR family oxidoreductase [Solirubrobacteraceae bacterium]|jgi:3-oxoacyl-[acyl-carrier protein] reductase|nr:SDR family oxidoreductase [Solirubrobacteraceae bacterium]